MRSSSGFNHTFERQFHGFNMIPKISLRSGINHTRDDGDLPDYEKIMISVIICFTAVVLVFLLHVSSRWIWIQSVRFRRWRRRRSASTPPRFYFAGEAPATLPNAGLDSAILETLPMFVYRSQNFTDGLECSVCLYDLEENEKGRLLPNCRHSFHLHCIDKWLLSNTTCPLCRTGAQPEQRILESTEAEQSATIKIEETLATISAPIASEIHHNLNSEEGQTASSEEEYDLQNPTNILSLCRNADTDEGTLGGKALMPHIVIDIPMKPDSFWAPNVVHQLHLPNYSQSPSKPPLTRLRSFTVNFNRERERKIFALDHPHACEVEHNGPAQGSRVWQRSYSIV